MRIAALSSAVILAIGVSAFSDAARAEVDPGTINYTVYQVTNSAGEQMAQVLVTGATAGDGFAANTEYWYMYENLSNSTTFTFTGGVSEPWSTAPSGLGTLSFTMTATPTWSSGTISGTLPSYAPPRGEGFYAVDWEMSESGGSWTGSITWWHSSESDLVGPSQSLTLTPGSTSGTHYYYTATPL